MKTASFIRKAADYEDLMQLTKKYPGHSQYQIEKIIELSAEEFKKFISNFYEDKDFIINNQSLMYFADGITYCIGITTEDSDKIILIDSQGYDYARYTAIINKKEVENG